jgi:uncharacterized protein
MLPAATNTDAEIEALDGLCARLAGFAPGISPEWLDGAMAAAIAGPRALLPGEWIPLLLGDAWERAIADPEDLAASTDTLMRRWNTIAAQLQPQRLYDEPDRLHLQPLIDVFDPAERDALVAEGKLGAQQAADWRPSDPGGDAALELESGLRCIEALAERDERRLKADLAIRYPRRTLSRDDLIDEACFAVQDLRCFWLEQRTRPAPRRVEKAPGRNDPCPCGSGRKYKKCHGADA